MPVPEPAGADHRERLLEGMASSVRAKGFQATTLADVVGAARVSRRTFYEHFQDPVDCYVALLEAMAAQMIARIVEAIEEGGTPDERLDRAVGSYLDLLEADPTLMRSFLRELHLTGERGAALLRAANERVGQTIHDLAEEARANEPELRVAPVPVPMARMIASGIVQMALMAQDEGRPLDEVRVTAIELLRRVTLT